MGQSADQPPGRLARQDRVGVERDDVANPRELREIVLSTVTKLVSRRPAKQAVELVELAALPLPAHPAALDGVPQPLAMEQEEAIRAVGSVALVQLADALEGGLDVPLILRHVLPWSVGEVGQQGEAKLRVGVGQVVDLQPFQQLRSAVRAREHARHDHEGGAVGGDAVLEVEPGQHARRQHPAQKAVGQGDGEFAGGQQRDEDDEHAHAPGGGGGQREQAADSAGSEDKQQAE